MTNKDEMKTLVEQALREKLGKAKTAEEVEKTPETPIFVEDEKSTEVEGKKLLSEALTDAGVTNFNVVGIDPYVTVYDKKDWDKHIRDDIPEADTDYVIDWNAFSAMALAIEEKEKPLMVGKPGVGKTTMVKLFAAITNHPYMRINGKDGLEPSSFLGTPWAEEGRMTWKDGAVTLACKKGYLLAFDEPFKVSAGINMAFQWLYEDDGKLFLDDKPGDINDKLVTPHENFRMVLCDNVRGLGDDIDKFGATTVQDSSSLDRFGMAIEVNYLNKEDEQSLLRNWFPDATDTHIKKAVQLAGLLRSAYAENNIELSMSPRGLNKFMKYSLRFRDCAPAFKLTFINKLSDENEISTVKGFYKTVFNEEI